MTLSFLRIELGGGVFSIIIDEFETNRLNKNSLLLCLSLKSHHLIWNNVRWKYNFQIKHSPKLKIPVYSHVEHAYRRNVCQVKCVVQRCTIMNGWASLRQVELQHQISTGKANWTFTFFQNLYARALYDVKYTDQLLRKNVFLSNVYFKGFEMWDWAYRLSVNNTPLQ